MISEHIYRRSRLRSDSFDAYNSLATRYPSNVNKNNEEYWSNGLTTHFSLSSSMQPKEDIRMDTPPSFSALDSHNSSLSSPFIDGGGTMATSPKQTVPSSTSNDNNGKSKPAKESNVVIKSILSGSVAGIASTVLFHPTDVLRTKIQSASFSVAPSAASTAATSSTASSSGSAAASAAVAATHSNNTRPVSVFMHTFRNGGLRALYTGMTPVLGAQAVYKATVFTTNNLTRRALIDFKTNERAKVGIFAPYTPTLFDTWFCGAMGGFINAILFVSPVEYVRNQQIAQHSRVSTAEGTSSEAMKRKMKSPIDIIRKTLKRDGPFGLWRGTGVTVLRDSLGCGSFFIMYELGKRHLGPHLGGRDSTATMLASGACAGWGFWAFALPLDTLKTLIQTGNATSAWDIVMLSIERDGFRKTGCLLVRGWQLAFGRGGPAAAITLSTYATTYDLMTKWLK